MEQAFDGLKAITGIFTTAIGCATLLTVIWMLRNFFITAVTTACLAQLRKGDTGLNRLIIRHFADKDVSAEKLYQELKERLESQQESE